MSNELILNTLAAEINTLNDALESSMGQTLRYAVLIGQKLNEAKEGVKHGEWAGWLAENCKKVSHNHANKYMRIAKEKPELANYSLKSNLDISTAYALLSAPEEVKTQVQEDLEAGKSVTQKEIQELKRQNKELEAAKLKAEAEAIRLANLPKAQLDDYEKTIGELSAKLESINEQYESKIKTITSDHKDLWDEKTKQSVRIAKEHDERVKGLEKALKDAKSKDAIESAKKALEDEIISGKNSAIAELERRIAQREQRLSQMQAKEIEIESKIGLRVKCQETLDIVNKSLMTISIELQSFQDLLSDSGELLNDAELAKWQKFDEQYKIGLHVVEQIIGDFNTLRLVSVNE